MFNGHKPHHPTYRFFLYFAERRGPGCCCARPINTAIVLTVFALLPAQRPHFRPRRRSMRAMFNGHI